MAELYQPPLPVATPHRPLELLLPVQLVNTEAGWQQRTGPGHQRMAMQQMKQQRSAFAGIRMGQQTLPLTHAGTA
jgi:hypothetical protein